jgi:hypothetical protein
VSEQPPQDAGLALDLAAAELRSDSVDIQALVGALAMRLEEALPGLVSVKRRRIGGFRSKRTEVESIAVSVQDARFELRRTPAGFDCTRHNVVRGITLKREQRPIADWINDVVAAVSRTADVGEHARATLQGLIA